MRLLVCATGIAAFGVGIWMIKSGISAEGVIDIHFREVLSGSLKTGSAGLFITFLAFWMILLSFLLGRRPVELKPKVHPSLPSRMPVMVTVLCIVWAVTIALYFVARNTSGGESVLFGFLTAGFFIGSLGCSFQTAEWWSQEHEEKKRATHPPQDKLL